jgi:hypothetical protein
MPRLDEFIERALTAFVTRLSGWGVLVVSLGLYSGVGLALPLLLHSRTFVLVMMNISATTVAGLIVLIWLAGIVTAQHRRHLVEWTTDLRLLSAEEFEWLVGELFRRDGWQVRETGRQDGPDGNIDLEIVRDSRRGIVQCKRWASRNVNVDEVRKFGGTLMREGLAGTAGYFVTLSDFHEQAREEARRIGLTLIDKRDLYARVENVRRAEPCPSCEAPMILDRSIRGWWLRCIAPGCQGKRDLGSEPGRAVDLLLRAVTRH